MFDIDNDKTDPNSSNATSGQSVGQDLNISNINSSDNNGGSTNSSASAAKPDDAGQDMEQAYDEANSAITNLAGAVNNSIESAAGKQQASQGAGKDAGPSGPGNGESAGAAPELPAP